MLSPKIHAMAIHHRFCMVALHVVEGDSSTPNIRSLPAKSRSHGLYTESYQAFEACTNSLSSTGELAEEPKFRRGRRIARKDRNEVERRK
jgi:hypothetical protein